MTELLSLPGRVPAEKTCFSCLYLQAHSFGHYPQVVIIGEGWNKDRPENREPRLWAQLSLHHNRPVNSPPHGRRCINPSVKLLLPSAITRAEDPKILELLHLRQNLTPNPEKALLPFYD